MVSGPPTVGGVEMNVPLPIFSQKKREEGDKNILFKIRGSSTQRRLVKSTLVYREVIPRCVLYKSSNNVTQMCNSYAKQLAYNDNCRLQQSLVAHSQHAIVFRSHDDSRCRDKRLITINYRHYCKSEYNEGSLQFDRLKSSRSFVLFCHCLKLRNRLKLIWGNGSMTLAKFLYLLPTFYLW